MFRGIHSFVLAALVTVCAATQWTCPAISVTDGPNCNCSQINQGVLLHCETESIKISEVKLGTKVNVTCKNNPLTLKLPSLLVGHINELALQDCLTSRISVQQVMDHLGIDHAKYLVMGGKSDSLSRSKLVHLTHIDTVSLKGLGLTNIPSDIFGNSSVKDLDLRGNIIRELGKGVFSGLSHLRGLFLSNNKLTTLPDGLFLHNMELTAIHLDYNQLHYLSSKLFEPLRNLQLLNLSNNRLKGLGGSVWRLPALRGLYLSSNQLTSLSDGTSQSVFRDCLNLTHINVANNSLSQIYDDWTRLTRLRELRLSHNHLQSIQIENFNFLVTNINVHLGYNKITEVTFIPSDLSETFNPKAAIIVYMHGNPFHCDCNIYPFVKLPKGSSSSVYFDIPQPDRRVVFKGTDKMVCASPQSMKSRPLMEIPLDDNSCVLRG